MIDSMAPAGALPPPQAPPWAAGREPVPTRRRVILALAVAALGVVDLLSALLSHPPERLVALRHLVPTLVLDTSRTLTLLAGALLIVTAWGLRRGKRRAYALALVLCAVSVPVNLLKALDLEEAVAATGLMLVLGLSADAFRVRSRELSIASFRSGAAWFAAALLAYALAGEMALNARYGMTTEWRLAVEDAAYSMLGIGHPVEIAPASLPPAESRLVTWYHRSLSVLGLGFVVFVAIGSLRPARHQRRHRAEVTRVKALIDTHGDSTVSAFALAEDVDYFFSRNGRAVIAYRFESDVLLGVGDPIGPEEELAPLLRDFEAHCREREWRFAFYQARPERLALYEGMGWRRLPIGLDPILHVERFTLEGGAIGSVRRAAHKAAREGMVVHHVLPGADDGARFVPELQAISQEWLRAHPGGEKNFCMGRFDPRHLPQVWWSVAMNPARGRVEGFVTWEPIPARRGWALDLMRRRHDAPEGTMELLVVSAVEAAKARGDALLSLGLAALARVDAGGEPGVAAEAESEPARAFLAAQLGRFYDFAGVFTWKRKFDPDFEPRYLVYPSALDLPFVAVALARVQSPGGFRSYLERLRPRRRAGA